MKRNEFMKYIPNYTTPKELAEIFPEGKQMVRDNIKLYEQEKQELREEMVHFRQSVENIVEQEHLDPFVYWFWAETYITHFYAHSIIEIDKQLYRLRSNLFYYEQPPKQPFAIKRDFKAEWEGKIRHAREVPIMTVAERYLAKARQVGNRVTALCPFHEEYHPSFSIYEESNTYHCFSCQKNGDVISFVMEIEGCTFKEALERLT